jgi:peptide chain release factor 2
VSLSLVDVRREIGDVYERLAILEKTAHLDDMKRELKEILEREATPAFWEDAFGHSGALVRQHRLSVEIRRLDDLRGQADLVRELCEASFQEGDDSVASDLTNAHAKLCRKLARAEREIVRFVDVDQGDAVVSVTAAGGRDGATEWASTLADMYAAWARERGYDVTQEGEGGTTVRVLGAYAFGYLRGERGSHRLILPPAAKDDRRGETFLARVEVRAATDDAPADSRPRGPTRDEPPIRTYDLWRSRGVRDRRTGLVDGDVKRVLAGRLDAFLEAFVDAATRTDARA